MITLNYTHCTLNITLIMNALRESYPVINSIKRELTLLIGIIMLFLVVSNCVAIFSNTHALHTSNKQLWMYDLFALLFWIINVSTWLATYWDVIKDNPIIHLSFFASPLTLMIWGTIVVSNIKEIIVVSLWHLFLFSYLTSIVVSTLFMFFIVQEIKKIQELDEETDGAENNGVIRGTYKLMSNSGEFLLNKQRNTNSGTYTKVSTQEDNFQF